MSSVSERAKDGTIVDMGPDWKTIFPFQPDIANI